MKDNEWCLDSGATSHTCNKREYFSDIDENREVRLQTAANKEVTAGGVGSVLFNLKDNGAANQVNLTDVLWTWVV